MHKRAPEIGKTDVVNLYAEVNDTSRIVSKNVNLFVTKVTNEALNIKISFLIYKARVILGRVSNKTTHYIYIYMPVYFTHFCVHNMCLASGYQNT